MPGPTYIMTTVGDAWIILQALRRWLVQNQDNPNFEEVRKITQALEQKVAVAREI